MTRLTEEQRMMVQAIREIVLKEIEPVSSEIDEKDEWPSDIIKILIDNGIHQIPLPEEYGGFDKVLTNCIAVEELARGSPIFGLWLAIQASCTRALKRLRDEGTRGKYLKMLAQGKIAAFAMTEEHAGNDVGAIRTIAVKDGDHYLINGEKCLISQGSVADLYVLFAKTQPEKGLKGVSTLVVERNTPGVSTERDDKKMGMRGNPASVILFENARVPQENLIGGIEAGFDAVNATRMYVASFGIGGARYSLDYATNYAKQRLAFGKYIAEYQAIQLLLADLATQLEAARSFVYRVAVMVDEGEDNIPTYTSMAKYFASEVAVNVAHRAMDVLGGHGYLKDHPLERILRDVKLTHYAEGTHIIHRLHVGRALFEGKLRY